MQPLQGIESREKEEGKDKKHIGKPIRQMMKINSRLKALHVKGHFCR